MKDTASEQQCCRWRTRRCSLKELYPKSLVVRLVKLQQFTWPQATYCWETHEAGLNAELWGTASLAFWARAMIWWCHLAGRRLWRLGKTWNNGRISNWCNSASLHQFACMSPFWALEPQEEDQERALLAGKQGQADMGLAPRALLHHPVQSCPPGNPAKSRR